jgi:hypothetical protein
MQKSKHSLKDNVGETRKFLVIMPHIFSCVSVFIYVSNFVHDNLMQLLVFHVIS